MINQAYKKKWSATLKRNYGITADQWLAIYDRQKGRCPICLRAILKPANEVGKRAACVDHDHKTGRVRGLLHFRCNKIKVSNHTVDTARRVWEYLDSEFDGREI